MQYKDNVWIQLLDSAQSADKKMSNWSIQHQTTICWDQISKGLITIEWNKILENLVPDCKWEDTMANHCGSMLGMLSHVEASEL
jgi:hypothetical protein